MIAEIAPLNQCFEVPYDVAKTMYFEGRINSDAKDENVPPFASKSKDDKWLIRRWGIPEYTVRTQRDDITLTGYIEIAGGELERLKELGAVVVSYAYSTSNTDNTIYTVSPYIEGLTRLESDESFHQEVAPVLYDYYSEILNDAQQNHGKLRPFLSDPLRVDQWSTSPVGESYCHYHDLDPYLSADPRHLQRCMDFFGIFANLKPNI